MFREAVADSDFDVNEVSSVRPYIGLEYMRAMVIGSKISPLEWVESVKFAAIPNLPCRK